MMVITTTIWRFQGNSSWVAGEFPNHHRIEDKLLVEQGRDDIGPLFLQYVWKGEKCVMQKRLKWGD